MPQRDNLILDTNAKSHVVDVNEEVDNVWVGVEFLFFRPVIPLS